jgi:hypothetical protein
VAQKLMTVGPSELIASLISICFPSSVLRMVLGSSCACRVAVAHIRARINVNFFMYIV